MNLHAAIDLLIKHGVSKGDGSYVHALQTLKDAIASGEVKTESDPRADLRELVKPIAAHANALCPEAVSVGFVSDTEGTYHFELSLSRAKTLCNELYLAITEAEKLPF